MVVWVEGEEGVKQDNLLKLTKIMRTSPGNKVCEDLRRWKPAYWVEYRAAESKEMTSMMRVKGSEVVRVWE